MAEMHQRHRAGFDIPGVEHRQIAAVFPGAPDRGQQAAWQHGPEPSERLRRDTALRGAVEAWFEAKPERPEHVPADDWLSFEQRKHSRLLEVVRARQTPTTETA